jgi:hypothetical protein
MPILVNNGDKQVMGRHTSRVRTIGKIIENAGGGGAAVDKDSEKTGAFHPDSIWTWYSWQEYSRHWR